MCVRNYLSLHTDFVKSDASRLDNEYAAEVLKFIERWEANDIAGKEQKKRRSRRLRLSQLLKRFFELVGGGFNGKRFIIYYGGEFTEQSKTDILNELVTLVGDLFFSQIDASAVEREVD